MEQTVTRRRRKKHQDRQNLYILVGILIVLLVAVVIVAVSIPQDPQGSDDPSVDPVQTTQSTEPIPIRELTLTAPAKTDFVSLEKELTFAGTADSREALTINGQAVAVASDGSFSHTVDLELGDNTIDVDYQGQTVTYRVEYRYGMQTFSPSAATEYGCGATIQLTAAIRQGAQLTVTLDGKTISMKESKMQLGSGLAEGFVLYEGTYKFSGTNTEPLDLGPITYTVTCDGITETFTSGNITCQKSGEILASDPSVTPDTGNYMDVGSGYIVEILTNSAETFEGSGTGDKSDPRMNYLPKGTVDYGSYSDVSNSAYTIRLRCGMRVYRQKTNIPSSAKVKVIDAYQGTLPDHNEIRFASLSQDDDYTILTLDVLWNAPFYFDILPQEYLSPSLYDFQISDFTAEYVDITFCYATVFEGTVQIPADNPLFSSAQLTMNEADCTLRLYLKKTGIFCGWDAYYNEQGQLCFRFVNPAPVTTSSNSYGVDLTGVRVLLDVGHGGSDGGTQPDGSPVDEAALNLILAEALKKELESMGATVILNRTDDSVIYVEERIAFLKEQAPDICIAIHHNSIAGYPNHNGCQVLYFTPQSYDLANLIYEETAASGIYKKTTLGGHVYYMARESACPVVLMENGYMTNATDLANMLDEAAVQTKAQAIASGIARYFLQINQ